MDIDPRDFHIVASISGGKDSCAMWLHLRDMGLDVDPVFMDTGWEAPETYQYLDHLGEVFGKEIARISDPGPSLPPDLEALALEYEARLGVRSPMVRWTMHKGTFPSRTRRWCTQQLKIAPMKAYLAAISDAEPLNAVGIRGEESKKRAAMPVQEYSDLMGCEVWRPIHAWTLADVIAIHTRHGVKPCELYLDGATRLGCWPCIYAAKKELETFGRRDRHKVAILRDMEHWLTDLKGAKRGWFQNRRDQTDGKPWHIDDVIEWARTARGGKQNELFTAHERDRGCMAWGLCATHEDT